MGKTDKPMEKTTKISYVKEVAIEMAVQRLLICSYLGLTEQRYCELQFEAGCYFIDKVISTPWPADKTALLRSSLFWGWWKMQWHERDVDFYAANAKNLAIYAKPIYRRIHSHYLVTDQEFLDHFFHHVDRMLIDGENRILNEKKGLVYA
jgi:hypothetical protein